MAAPPGAQLLGYVPGEDLPALYAAATAVGYVSVYEGFGLPPLEAMACGAAVVATPVGALPDVADDGIEFVPVGDPEAIVAALRVLAEDRERRAELVAAGIRAAGRLSYADTARGTAAVYRSLGLR